MENAPVQIYLCSELSRTDKRLVDLTRCPPRSKLRRDTPAISTHDYSSYLLSSSFHPPPLYFPRCSPSREKIIVTLCLFFEFPLLPSPRAFLLFLRSRVFRGEVHAFGGVKNDAATLRIRWKNRRRGGVSNELTFDL